MGLPDREGNTPTGKPIRPGKPGGPQKTKGIYVKRKTIFNI